ncbi:SRPBCC domain-containing protein [Chitinophaga niabensis]|uniref:SRPBCC family protein n=1 Tax=Chitinophaga niabensis TaxID=536979 RepID=UPI0031BB9C3F
MQTANFTTTLVVDKSPMEVFNAICQPQNWWSGEVEGHALKMHDEFTYKFKDFHFSRQRVTTLIPGEKVVWDVIESIINYAEDKEEWTGTQIIFEVFEKDAQTNLRFTHSGLVPEVECFDSCSNSWTQLVHHSLFSLITAGKGLQLNLA